MWILIVLCIVQLSISLFWACQKNYLFFDEVFSFQAANTAREERVEFLENEWMDESWYTSFMSVDEKDTFDYSIPFNNQIADVHPPLYYLFLHTVCSLFPGEVSFLMGMSVNILFFLGSTIAIYFLSKEILDRKDSALLAAVLYGVSYGGLNTMVYIRMYMLLTLMTLLHALVYMKHMEKQEVSWKGYGLLLITLVGGALSQYYFLFIAFFFGIWYSIKFFVEKRFKELGKYLATVFASAAISLLIWPSMISHMFGGSRGEEATGNLLSFDGYFLGLKEMFRILNNDLFTKLLPVILVGILVLFLICLKKGERFQVRQWNKAWVLLFVCVGYFLLVTKVAPYQVDRYVMPIYPFVMILVVGAAYTLFRKSIKPLLRVSKLQVLNNCVVCSDNKFGCITFFNICHNGSCASCKVRLTGYFFFAFGMNKQKGAGMIFSCPFHIGGGYSHMNGTSAVNKVKILFGKLFFKPRAQVAIGYEEDIFPGKPSYYVKSGC